MADSETTGLTRGSGMTEFALHNLEKSTTNEWIFKPNMVVVDSALSQDRTRLAASPGDRHHLREYAKWKQLITEQVFNETGTRGSWTDTEDSLKVHNRFLYRSLKEDLFPQLSGRELSPTQVRARGLALGIDLTSKTDVDIRSLLAPGSELETLMKGHTVWIANVGFEGKQLGARFAAIRQEGGAVGIHQFLETRSPNTSDLYTTGRKVNLAKVAAQQTGDWRGVYKAMVANPVKPGEIQIRDIQDLVRATMSYGRKLGMIDVHDEYFGSSIEVQQRLLASVDPDPVRGARMMKQQTHRAVEDVASSESYVLRRHADMLEVLRHVDESTPEGMSYLKAAKEGRGELVGIANYMKRTKILSSELVRGNLVQRIGRATLDLMETGKSVQTAGYERIIQMKQVTPSGEEQIVPRTAPRRRTLTSMEAVLGHLEEDPRYEGFGVSPKQVHQQMTTELGGSPSVGAINEWVDRNSKDALQHSLRKERGELWQATSMELSDVVHRRMYGPGLMGMMELPHARGMAMAGGAAALLALGGALAPNRSQTTKPPPSMMSVTYDDWIAHQAIPGMGETGIAGVRRSDNTDFGSPYRGPVTSNDVLANQDLLQERERWLRERYTNERDDPEYGLFGVHSPFKGMNLRGRAGYRFLSDPSIARANAASYGMQGKLLELDLANYRVTAEDADTIRIQKAGMMGAVGSFFGLNKGYSFRLAGIDSPETSHGDSYHAPQPHAEESSAAFKEMMAGKSLKLVFDPSQTTYGRMMGAVIADGKNLNYELVRTGQAAYLPYGKRSNSIIDYNKLQSIERVAAKAHQGMWSQPWEQTYMAAMESAGNRMTFNTFTKKEKIVESGSRMNLITLMEVAQKNGMSSGVMVAASNIGSQIKRDKFKADYSSSSPTMGPTAHPSQAFMGQMMQDQKLFMNTHGTGNHQNKFSRRGHYGRDDSYMAYDSLNTTNSVWTKRRMAASETYDVRNTMRRERKARMAESQRAVNQTVFNSGIGHAVM